LVALVEAGPQAGNDKVVRWRRADLRDRLKQDFGLVLHERTVGKLLDALGYRRLSVRPFNPKMDPAAQGVFGDIDVSLALSNPSSRIRAEKCRFYDFWLR
jgi:hypothetical protein